MKALIGKVVSTKMNKTVSVLIETQRLHPRYKKAVWRKKMYHVQDDLGVKEGQLVKIVETRPLSRTKKWKILSQVELKKQKTNLTKRKSSKKT